MGAKAAALRLKRRLAQDVGKNSSRSLSWSEQRQPLVCAAPGLINAMRGANDKRRVLCLFSTRRAKKGNARRDAGKLTSSKTPAGRASIDDKSGRHLKTHGKTAGIPRPGPCLQAKVHGTTRPWAFANLPEALRCGPATRIRSALRLLSSAPSGRPTTQPQAGGDERGISGRSAGE